jgi:hypothetical protein
MALACNHKGRCGVWCPNYVPPYSQAYVAALKRKRDAEAVLVEVEQTIHAIEEARRIVISTWGCEECQAGAHGEQNPECTCLNQSDVADGGERHG